MALCPWVPVVAQSDRDAWLGVFTESLAYGVQLSLGKIKMVDKKRAS